MKILQLLGINKLHGTLIPEPSIAKPKPRTPPTFQPATEVREEANANRAIIDAALAKEEKIKIQREIEAWEDLTANYIQTGKALGCNGAAITFKVPVPPSLERQLQDAGYRTHIKVNDHNRTVESWEYTLIVSWDDRPTNLMQPSRSYYNGVSPDKKKINRRNSDY